VCISSTSPSSCQGSRTWAGKGLGAKTAVLFFAPTFYVSFLFLVVFQIGDEMEASAREWTAEEVAKHNTKEDCYVIVHGMTSSAPHGSGFN
jgi:hypothetical protein